MIDGDIIEVLRRKFTRLESELNERGDVTAELPAKLPSGPGFSRPHAQRGGPRAAAWHRAPGRTGASAPEGVGQPDSPIPVEPGSASRSRPCLVIPHREYSCRRAATHRGPPTGYAATGCHPCRPH